MANWLLSNCFLAFALALGVVGFVRLFRPSPATVHALWCLVLLKLVSPIGLWWELSVRLPQPKPEIRQELPTPPPNPVFEARFVEVVPEPIAANAIVPETTSWTRSWEPAPTVEPAQVLDPLPPVARRESTPLEFLGLILLIGGAVYLLRQTLSTWRFRRLARFAQVAPDALFAQVRSVSRDLGVSEPRVVVLRGLPSPVIWTLGRPVLLWPEGLERSLDSDGREAVLIHELAHLRRRDHWVRRLEVLCGVFHWWNPLFWLARRQVRLHAELACDAWVMASKPEHRRSYAEALLQVCTRSMRVSPAPALGIGGDGTRDFQRRLTMIMRNDSPCRLSRRGRAAVLLLALVFLPGLTLAQVPPPEKSEIVEVEFVLQESPKTPPTPTQVEADKEKRIKDLEAKLAELNKLLAEMKGIKPIERKEYQYKYEIVQKDGKDGSTAKAPQIRVLSGKDGKIVADANVQVISEGDGKFKIVVIGADGKPKEDLIILTAQSQSSGSGTTVPVQVPLPSVPVPVRGNPKVIEIKEDGQRIIAARTIIDTKSGDSVINLTRASYSLSKEQADGMMTMFKEKSKNTVLEMKYENDKLVVTTTPEVQGVIGNVVSVLTGKPIAHATTNFFGGMGGGMPGQMVPARIAVPASAPMAMPTVPAPAVVPKTPSVPKAAPEKPNEPEALQAPRILTAKP